MSQKAASHLASKSTRRNRGVSGGSMPLLRPGQLRLGEGSGRLNPEPRCAPFRIAIFEPACGEAARAQRGDRLEG